MAAFELTLGPEQIEALVRDSIMKSGFGAAIETAIAKVMSNHRNPVEEALRDYVQRVVVNMLEGELGERVRESVNAYVLKEVTTEFLDKITEVAVEKIKRAADEY